MSLTPLYRPLMVIRSDDKSPALSDRIRKVMQLDIPVLLLCDKSFDLEIDSEPAVLVGRLDLPDASRCDGAFWQHAGQWASQHNYSHIVTLTSSGFQAPPARQWLFHLIEEHPTALIVGHRDARAAVNSSTVGPGLTIRTLLMRLVSGYDYAGKGTYFHVYPVMAFDPKLVWLDRCTDEFEIQVRLIWAGINVEEQPVLSVNGPEEQEKTGQIYSPGSTKLRMLMSLMARQCLPRPHKRLFNRGPDFNEFSWGHPLQSLISLHRRVYRKLDNGEKRLSLRHPIRSLRILHLERMSPMEIALACFLGIFIGSSPLLGFHTIGVIFYATRFRINRALSFYMSNPCAPIFPPFVPAWEIELGFYFRYGRFLTLADVNTQEALFKTLGMEAHLRLWEYFLGWLIIGPLLAMTVSFSVYIVAMYYQRFLGNIRVDTHDKAVSGGNYHTETHVYEDVPMKRRKHMVGPNPAGDLTTNEKTDGDTT